MKMADVFPPADIARELPPDNLAKHLLLYLREHFKGDSFNISSLADDSTADFIAYSKDDWPGMIYPVSEALEWLLAHGLVAHKMTPTQGMIFFVTRKGNTINSHKDFDEFKHACLLRKDVLNSKLTDKAVWPDFARGDYGSAILKACKVLEVAIRNKSEFPNSLFGKDLARKAFHSEHGPLRDDKKSSAENQSLSDLMAGAFGYFRNPEGHRDVEYTPQEAAEIILFLNHLIRIVESTEPVSRLHKASKD